MMSIDANILLKQVTNPDYNKKYLVENIAFRCVDGFYEGSIIPISGFKTGRKLERAYRPELLAVSVTAIYCRFEDKPIRVGVSHWGKLPTVKKSHVEILIDCTTPFTVFEKTITPLDCFGQEYKPGSIVSYRRDNCQTFGEVRSIDEHGMIRLRRFYNSSDLNRNKSTPSVDRISFKQAPENMIITKDLHSHLLKLRLSH